MPVRFMAATISQQSQDPFVRSLSEITCTNVAMCGELHHYLHVFHSLLRPNRGCWQVSKLTVQLIQESLGLRTTARQFLFSARILGRL